MKVLLHICCGICALSVIERLQIEGHAVTGYFYNPNIHPQDEYKKRLEVAEKAAESYGIDLVEERYDRENWFLAVKGQENEPEGGGRCKVCYKMRLQKTYEYSRYHHFDLFTTTLTVGPMKEAAIINQIGRDIGEDRFICADFKKKDGFKRSIELAKEMELFRQDYCGCIYSLEEKYRREKK